MDPKQPSPQPAQNTKQQVIDRLKEANNVLVTVSNNPSVDQLAACIGFTLVLNKLSKHGTAVFSGAIPSTIEFLQPEKTLEKNTDSLRDFIIALDKSKADKLRYKIEDKFVKIFITPYRTSIGEEDLEFSQGDFNVDVVVALGVHKREELDQAITAHGRILHDATIISVNTRDGGTDIGAINWRDDQVSSLSEMMVSIAEALKPGLLDTQTATAFLTGIVAETDRFSNDKTSPATMAVAGKLMDSGANQQLIATKLEEPKPIPKQEEKTEDQKLDELASEKPIPGANGELPRPNDGSLNIPHGEEDEIHIDDEGTLRTKRDLEKKIQSNLEDSQRPDQGLNGPDNKMVLTPPSMGGTLTASGTPEPLESSTDPLSRTQGGQPFLIHSPYSDNPSSKQEEKLESQTLEEIEESINSPHVGVDANVMPQTGIDTARKAVETAAQSSPAGVMDPIQALNAQPVNLDLGHNELPTEPGPKQATPAPNNNAPSFNNSLFGVPSNDVDKTAGTANPSAPPVPPPMMPPAYMPPDTEDKKGSLPPDVPL